MFDFDNKYEIEINYNGRMYRLSGYGNPQDNPSFKKLPKEVREQILDYSNLNNFTPNDEQDNGLLGLLGLLALCGMVEESRKKPKKKLKADNSLPSIGKTLNNIPDDYDKQ